VAFDTANPFPKTKHGNIYVLVVINHYSKWCEARTMVDHDVEMAAKFLEHEVIYKFGVPEYIFMNNGYDWSIISTPHLTSLGVMEWWKG
jgi:hypothetical protein